MHLCAGSAKLSTAGDLPAQRVEPQEHCEVSRAQFPERICGVILMSPFCCFAEMFLAFLKLEKFSVFITT